MRVGVLRTQVPFVTGGAERHAKNLCSALQAHGHEAVEITLPFKWYPASVLADHILSAKLVDVSEVEGVPIDLVVGLKFPAWLIRHPNKVFWVLHQHRQAYDQWELGNSDLLNDPDGSILRRLIHEEDRTAFAASPRPIYANSQNVAHRLKTHLNLPSQVLYHPPPMADRMRQGKFGDYLFAPGRINPSKRLDLILKALAKTKSPLRLIIAGTAENPTYADALMNEAKALGIDGQVEWLGAVTDEVLLRYYAESRAVVFVPQDEDYGYITLEAMLSGKPVITVKDAGGPLEFITDGKEGLVCDTHPTALAEAFDRVMQDMNAAERMGIAGFKRYNSMYIGWDHVVQTLTGAPYPINGISAKAITLTNIDTSQEAEQKLEPTSSEEKLRAAIAPPPNRTTLPFSSITELLEAYTFDTIPRSKDAPAPLVEPGLAAYLGTHWQRFCTTLDLVVDLNPKHILDVGVFPPLAFEAMLVNALPGVTIDGVWEGPRAYRQKVESYDNRYPGFDISLAPANIERDPLPFSDNSFDLVLGMEIFEHLALDPYFFLSEAARVLQIGGHLILTTPNVGSHRGVGKILNGQSPYSFGIFVPTGGVYGRHNREYTPTEVALFASSAGFETVHLNTVDVYDNNIDPATADLLTAREDNLNLRGETIFFVGRKIGMPNGAPTEFYHGEPDRMSGHLRVDSYESTTGLTRIVAENRSKACWSGQDDRATCILAEWVNQKDILTHTNIFLPLGASVSAGDMQSILFRLDPDGIGNGTLVLHLFQKNVGYLTGTGRANKLELPCSEETFLRLVSHHTTQGGDS